MAPVPPESAVVKKDSDPTLVQAAVWDVYTPAPTTSIKGTVMPSFLSRTRRRISVEVYSVPVIGKDGKKSTESYEECFIRILSAVDKSHLKASKQKGKEAKKAAKVGNEDFRTATDDESTVAGDLADSGGGQEYEGWKAKYKLPLKTVHVDKVDKKNVTFSIKYKSIKQTRRILFDTEDDVIDFVNFLNVQKEKDSGRMQKRFTKETKGLPKVDPSTPLTFLVEVVGCVDLPAADITSSDPYVVVFYDGMTIHKTETIKNQLDPIYTLKEGSLCLFETTAESLFTSSGLQFDVMDFDTVGKNDRLGHCMIPAQQVYTSKGERLVFKLANDEGKGELAVRIRHATEYDKNFLAKYEESRGKSISEQPQTAGGKNALQSVVSRNEKTEKLPNGDQIKKFKVRPHPDPKDEEGTTWLTMPQMESMMHQESREWVDTGSGNVGRLYVEVLSCSGLPNLDTGGFLGNKTDAFVCLVFEDTWAQTDTIDDDLDPKWMPWTKRAFIFHMQHPSSELFVGLFDCDAIDDHDLIGRVAIDVSNLQPDTVYNLTYNAYPSSKVVERKAAAKVTIRLRMEIDDDRALLLSCLEPPKPVYVNVKRPKDLHTIHNTCFGSHDMDSYSLKTFFMYLDELQAYQHIVLYLIEAAITLLFWRPHHQINLPGGVSITLPVHSMVAFFAAITVVERPQLVPSFSFATIAWLLLCTMMFRRGQPSLWRRCKSFQDMLIALVYGDSFPPAKIAANENREEAETYEEEWRKKFEDSARKAEEAALEAKMEAEEAEKELKEIGEDEGDIAKKKGPSLSVDLLRPYMEPLQVYLAIACKLIRYIRNILLWQECYLAFWIALGSMVLSVACVFVPWFFIIRWTSRLIVWTLFGPWMRLVDIYYWTPMENMTEEEIAAQKAKAAELRKKLHIGAVEKARVERENARKLKAMKRYLFGKHIIKVPILKEDRWRDFPLPESTAEPYKAKPLALAELAMKEAGYHRIRVPGQNLEGDMIPSIESKAFTDAPVGQATKEHAQSETDAAAYAKVGALVAGAGVITYFGVPLVSQAATSIFGGNGDVVNETAGEL